MPEAIKDRDCTIDTPVILGKQDDPIYGKGISIKPRVPGRQDSNHFKSIYLEELLPLEEYDLIVVLFSGGKDSTACYLKLVELGVPKEKIELWHHDIEVKIPASRRTFLRPVKSRSAAEVGMMAMERTRAISMIRESAFFMV